MKMVAYASTESRYASPLRYPGGKAGFANFLQSAIRENDLDGCQYYEPFAGGAGAALTLLERGTVSKIHLNDADFRIYAFWNVVLRNSKQFVQLIRRAKLNIDEWYSQREICLEPEKHTQLKVAFATFFMNRCNRSGVITGAGPIGGYQQSGTWTLDVRFNREALAERILKVSHLKRKITISNHDALQFLTEIPQKERKQSFIYLDPPYVRKGQRLYLNAYSEEDHERLANVILAERRASWVISYDNTPLVNALYATERVLPLPVRYTLQKKRSGRELLIVSRRLKLPAEAIFKGRKWSLARVRENR